jgi:hypothetical protein
MLTSLLGGLWAALLASGCYALALGRLPVAEARAVAFSALILCNLGLLLVHRRAGGAADALRTRNPVFLAIALAALGVLVLTLYLPALAALLSFAAPPPAWLAFALGTAFVMTAVLQLARRG